MDDIAIKVEGVGKTLKLPHEKQTSLKGAFINLLKVAIDNLKDSMRLKILLSIQKR